MKLVCVSEAATRSSSVTDATATVTEEPASVSDVTSQDRTTGTDHDVSTTPADHDVTTLGNSATTSAGTAASTPVVTPRTDDSQSTTTTQSVKPMIQLVYERPPRSRQQLMLRHLGRRRRTTRSPRYELIRPRAVSSKHVHYNLHRGSIRTTPHSEFWQLSFEYVGRWRTKSTTGKNRKAMPMLLLKLLNRPQGGSRGVVNRFALQFGADPQNDSTFGVPITVLWIQERRRTKSATEKNRRAMPMMWRWNVMTTSLPLYQAERFHRLGRRHSQANRASRSPRRGLTEFSVGRGENRAARRVGSNSPRKLPGLTRHELSRKTR